MSAGPRPSRIRLALTALAAGAGLLLLGRSSWYREYRLQRLSETALRAWTERRPDDALGHFYLAMALGRTGETRAAAGELARAVELEPALTQARWRLAAVLTASGREAEAERLLRRGLELDPGAAPLYAGLGRLYEQRGDLRPAAAAWERAAARAPTDDLAWYHLGRCWMALNQESKAVTAYRRAVDLAPRSAMSRKALAGALRLQREYAEGETQAQRAVELAPDDPDAQFVLAKLRWDRDGPMPAAEASLRRAVSLQPDSPLLRYSLASLLQQRGDRAGAAREYAATLHLLSLREPPSSAAWDARERWLSQVEGPHFNLARILPRLGRPVDGAEHLARFRQISDYRNRVRQALVRLANRPGDAALHFALARAHAAAGDRGLAAAQYEAGLRLHSDAQARTELLALRGKRNGAHGQ